MPNVQILPTAEAFRSEKPNLSVSAAPSQLPFQGSQVRSYHEPLYHRTPLFHRFAAVPGLLQNRPKWVKMLKKDVIANQ